MSQEVIEKVVKIKSSTDAEVATVTTQIVQSSTELEEDSIVVDL